MIRTFLAVELSDVLRGSLAAIQQDLQKRVCPDLPKTVRLSWVPPASMHLTLKFFGMMDEDLVDPLRAALQPLVNGHFPVSVPLERLAAFPRIEQPRVLWIGPPPQWEQARTGAAGFTLAAGEDVVGLDNAMARPVIGPMGNVLALENLPQ